MSELLNMPELSNADIEMIWFDDNSILNGGTGSTGYKNTKTTRNTRSTTTTTTSTSNSLDCYIDGFRIYHPLNENHNDYITSEHSASYHNVVNSLLDAESTDLNGIAYVTPNNNESGNTSLTLESYKQFGPKNELYLTASNEKALTFKVQLPNENSRIHLGLRAVNGPTVVKIGTTDFAINSPTEMYYDISNCIRTDDNGYAIITIQNTGESILAVNTVKFTDSASIGVISEEDMTIAHNYMMASPTRANVVNGVVTIKTETNTPENGENNENNENDINDSNDISVDSSLSFIKELIAKIFELLSKMFTFAI
jgi:hypothetical protein